MQKDCWSCLWLWLLVWVWQFDWVVYRWSGIELSMNHVCHTYGPACKLLVLSPCAPSMGCCCPVQLMVQRLQHSCVRVAAVYQESRGQSCMGSCAVAPARPCPGFLWRQQHSLFCASCVVQRRWVGLTRHAWVTFDTGGLSIWLCWEALQVIEASDAHDAQSQGRPEGSQ